MPRKSKTFSTCAVEKVKAIRVSVLGSGKVGAKDPGYHQAVELGAALAREGFTVCHGGYHGIMEAVAKGCEAGGGRNTAVTIQELPILRPGLRMGKRQTQNGLLKSANPWVNTEIAMPSWQARLFKLIEMGDACIFLDGATGTLTELFVVLEMTNRGLLKKPIIILGKKLGALLRSLAKDPHFDLPPALYFATSVSQAVKILIGCRG